MTTKDAADTIAAISTPLGEAGIGIVRVSGPEAAGIARSLFRPRRPRPQLLSHHLYLGQIVAPDSQEVIDEVLLTFMQGPRTYTREDVVEIHCHSGWGVLQRLLELTLACGARLARPGEFTLRAFLSGRIDLTQAEAVLEVIKARTDAGVRVAAEHLQGHLGRELKEIRETLLDLLARVEAALDFPEETAEVPATALAADLAPPLEALEALIASYREGRLLKEGLLVVIAGAPNVGKSSLLNRLLAQERAIVTEIPGTTRDLVEEVITLGGVMVRFSDTAGLRPAQDQVEELGIKRTRERLAQADLLLYLVDGSRPLTPEARQDLEDIGERIGLAVINKVDLPQELNISDLQQSTSLPVIKISALTGDGIDDLKARIVDLTLMRGLNTTGKIVTQARHYRHLSRCRDCLHQARNLLTEGEAAWELVALELQEAIRELGEITGQEVGDDVLDRIFGEFCLGK
ncbi:MAG: tRNA uridine-5-carboxymethylaminomethyl(34) synthesis GTPase MnmE [Syntrophales bacterium]|nr:tRNA uridine-5-carboxymethylaminomethyl(34) synthesis GTPase MnmE [Syntrophales bacterium]MDD5642534.1 tRNA uridine-5-carboxymethylaminomethyl(34) synthesis GTPase MnmE [Syntrophales bacterium]